MAHANGEGGTVGAANAPFLVEAERWTVASATYRELLAAAQLARTLPKDAPAEPDQKVRLYPRGALIAGEYVAYAAALPRCV